MRSPFRIPILPFVAALVAGAFGAAGAAVAQAGPGAARPPLLDSGPIDHHGHAPQVVFRATLRPDPAAVWIRLRFGSSHLPPGSALRLTGVRDRAVETVDARGLARSGHRSAYFNGAAVTVELIAGPATRHNRVTVVATELGHRGAGQPSLCGNDNRTRSFDNRVCRLGGSCTAFLIADDLALSAGHCLSADTVVEFNVPLSSPTGQINFAAPHDQYNFQLLSRVDIPSVPGADWAIGRIQRNITTGLLPTEAYGVAPFRLGVNPAAPTGVTVRLTGYGLSQTPTLSQVQQTDAGALVTIGAQTLSYRVDTTGGSSGSPIVDTVTGHALGIHTDSGCTRIGGSNAGTSWDRADLLAAIRALLPGQLRTFGTGCPGAAGPPLLGLSGSPWLGGTVTVQVSGTPAAATPGLLIAGLSDTLWGTIPLPLRLDFAGMPGCHLWVSVDWTAPLDSTAARAFPVPIPAIADIVGGSFYLQYVLQDPVNQAGLVVSNAGSVTIAR